MKQSSGFRFLACGARGCGFGMRVRGPSISKIQHGLGWKNHMVAAWPDPMGSTEPAWVSEFG